jgi:ubiquinone/menaquinone biosynthesis C-methylase UbiE
MRLFDSPALLRTRGLLLPALLAALFPGFACRADAPVAEATTPASPHYVEGQRHPGGTGRYYFGREIARYMSHHGADWLERTEREAEEAPSRLHEWLAVPPGAVVADVGAGTGFHARRLAAAVGPEGRVYAADIQPEMLERLQAQAENEGLRHIETVLATTTDPGLPAGCCDLVLLVDVYHELSHPYEVMERLVQALKPGGRLVLVEFRADEAAVPIHPLHTMSEAQLQLEMAIQPLEWLETWRDLPWQMAMVYRRPPLP